MKYVFPGEDVRRYIAGPPGPPGPPGYPGYSSYTFNMQEVAERVLSLMSGECSGPTETKNVLGCV